MKRYQVRRENHRVTITHPNGHERVLRGIDHIQLIETLDLVQKHFEPTQNFATYEDWQDSVLALYFPAVIF